MPFGWLEIKWLVITNLEVFGDTTRSCEYHPHEIMGVFSFSRVNLVFVGWMCKTSEERFGVSCLDIAYCADCV